MPHYHAPHSRCKIRRLNARQRKKFHLLEFQNFTFYLEGKLLPEFQTAEYFDKFVDEVIDFIEQNQICTAGGGEAANFSFIFDHAKKPPHNITANQRDMLIHWFVVRNDVAEVRSGDLIDGYYSDENEWFACPHIHK